MIVIPTIIAASVMLASADMPTGKKGEGHGQLHGFYAELFNNQMRITCCNNKDCRPTQSRMVGDHYEIMINGVWRSVDQKWIIKKTAPDYGAHICAGDPSTSDPQGRVYCVILPPET